MMNFKLTPGLGADSESDESALQASLNLNFKLNLNLKFKFNLKLNFKFKVEVHWQLEFPSQLQVETLQVES